MSKLKFDGEKHNCIIKLFLNAVKSIEKWLNLTIKSIKQNKKLKISYLCFLFVFKFYTKKTNAPFLNGFRDRWNHFIDSTDLQAEISQKSKQTEN